MGNKSKHRKENDIVHPATPPEAPEGMPGEKPAAESAPEIAGADELRARLETKEKEAAENHDRYLRAMAEMENYKKRAARDKEDAIKYGNEKLIKDILPILDSLDRALHQSSDLSVRNNFEAFQAGTRADPLPDPGMPGEARGGQDYGEGGRVRSGQASGSHAGGDAGDGEQPGRRRVRKRLHAARAASAAHEGIRFKEHTERG